MYLLKKVGWQDTILVRRRNSIDIQEMTGVTPSEHEINRMESLKAFDETKAGVKGLVDSGLNKVPNIFVRPSKELDEDPTTKSIQIQFPVIDLSGILDRDGRRQIIEQVKIASETWGFFQVVNHGIPLDVLDGIIEDVRKFNEQDLEEKKMFYSRDRTRSVTFGIYDLFTSRTAGWRDTLSIHFSDPNKIIYEGLPPCCRDSIVEFSKHTKILGDTMLGLLSEALGLKMDHLKDMDCSAGHRLHCHYYPACLQLELTIGTTKHTDGGFLTILLQSQNISGLQVKYQDQWVDISPIPGGLVVNIGDLLQLVSNGRFKSVAHRAISNCIGPRITVGCFFTGPIKSTTKFYATIQELISEENPPIYKEIQISDYYTKAVTTGLDNYRGLEYYKL